MTNLSNVGSQAGISPPSCDAGVSQAPATFRDKVFRLITGRLMRRPTPAGVQQLRDGQTGRENTLPMLKRNIVWLFSKIFRFNRGSSPREIGPALNQLVSVLPRKSHDDSDIHLFKNIYGKLGQCDDEAVVRDGLKLRKNSGDHQLSRQQKDLAAKKRYLERVAGMLRGTKDIIVGINKPEGKQFFENPEQLKSFMTQGVNMEIDRYAPPPLNATSPASAAEDDAPPPPPSSAPPAQNMDKEWVHFQRKGSTSSSMQYRVYLNVKNHAVQHVFGDVVKAILNDPTGFPGVGEAKVCGPLDKRGDSIVIYVDSKENLKKVVDRVKEFQDKKPDRFIDAVPALTGKLAPGISVGSEPTKTMKDKIMPLAYKYLDRNSAEALNNSGFSFGSARALSFTICSAMTKVDKDYTSGRKTYDEVYNKNLKIVFHQVGIDAEKPYRNLGDNLELDVLQD